MRSTFDNVAHADLKGKWDAALDTAIKSSSIVLEKASRHYTTAGS
jgi:hypothetical protein